MSDQTVTPYLEGVRVLDFTQYLAGPTVTRLMAEMGAEIIKIELAPGGDPSRGLLAAFERRVKRGVDCQRGVEFASGIGPALGGNGLPRTGEPRGNTSLRELELRLLQAVTRLGAVLAQCQRGAELACCRSGVSSCECGETRREA